MKWITSFSLVSEIYGYFSLLKNFRKWNFSLWNLVWQEGYKWFQKGFAKQFIHFQTNKNFYRKRWFYLSSSKIMCTKYNRCSYIYQVNKYRGLLTRKILEKNAIKLADGRQSVQVHSDETVNEFGVRALLERADRFGGERSFAHRV